MGPHPATGRGRRRRLIPDTDSPWPPHTTTFAALRYVRAVAVLVVATPCPLLLAAPVAIVSGLSRAARQGVVIRSGGALETSAAQPLSSWTRPEPHRWPTRRDRSDRGTRPDAAEALRLAASVDQLSPHVLAEAIVTEALTRGSNSSVMRPLGCR